MNHDALKASTYRMRNESIEAIQLDEANYRDVAACCGGEYFRTAFSEEPFILVPTLSDMMMARLGDWVTRDAEGNWSACKRDTFKFAYEPVPKVEVAPAATAGTVGETMMEHDKGLIALASLGASVVRFMTSPPSVDTWAEDEAERAGLVFRTCFGECEEGEPCRCSNDFDLSPLARAGLAALAAASAQGV